MHYILVVEDDEATQDVIRVILEMEGYESIFVSNGADALSVIASTPPILILLDIQMPLMSGTEFLDVYCNSAYTQVPVIVLSAYLRTMQIQHPCVTNFIAKPFDLDVLLRCIHGALPELAS